MIFPIVCMQGIERLLRPIFGRSLAIQTGAHTDDYFMQITSYVACHLVGLYHNDLAPLRCQSSFDILKSESHEPLSVFHNNRVDLRIGEQLEHIAAMTIESRTNLFYGINDHKLVGNSIFSQTRQLPIQIIFLVVA